jgi:hypothetical protein
MITAPGRDAAIYDPGTIVQLVERRIEILREFRQIIEEIKGKFIYAEHYNFPR